MRTLILITLAAHLSLPTTYQPDELNRLNQCIQQRFLNRTSFGMQRIAPRQFHGVRQFRPENATEQAVVNRLEQQGYEVALFLAGRNINSAGATGALLAAYRYGVQGPASVTKLRNPPVLPRPESLLEESRAALAAFETSPGYDIQRGDWTIALRPLRAANQRCLQCHTTTSAPVKIGDPLGVILYAYRETHGR